MKILKSEKGVALIVVLWVMVILSFLLISLSEDIQLESYLTRNIMEKTHIKYVAQAGIARGIAALQNDETLADGVDENWVEPIEAQIEDKGTFEVEIEDIGSRFNINNVGDPVLTALFNEESKGFSKWRIQHYPIIISEELSEYQGIEIAGMEDMITYYGNFNILTDDQTILKEIMIANDVTTWSADQMIEKIEEMKESKEPIKSFDQLMKKVPGFDMTTYERIKDDVDMTGNINVNLASKKVLKKLVDSLDLSVDNVEAISKLRQEHTIKDINELKQIITEENLKRLTPYLDVNSRYFRITCHAKSTSKSLEKKIVVELERIPEKISQGMVLEWRTKILSWLES